MKQQTWWVLVAAVVVCAGSGRASAQFGPPPIPGGQRPLSSPAFSPYLNLLRGGSPALNYYGIVRPQLQARQAINNLNNELNLTQQVVGAINPGVGMPSATGHPTQFLNLGGYFMNNGPTGQSGRVGATGPAIGGASGIAPPARRR